jgi:hypothetical protein
MAMSDSEDLMPGRLLLTRYGADIPELCYQIIKLGLTVLEKRPRKSWLRYFLKPEYQTIDSEQLLEIIQHDFLKLENKLFLTSEAANLPPPRKIDAEASFLRAPHPEPDKEKRESESKPSDSSVEKEPRGNLDNKFLLRMTIEDHESHIKKSPNVFSFLGKVWFIKFNNEEWGLYPDYEKYKYLANLLSLSSEITEGGKGEYAIHIVGLLARVKGNELPAESEVEPDEEGLSHTYLSEEITKEEIGRIGEIGHQLLDQLRQARMSQDQERIHKVLDIIGKYRSHLLKEYGIRTRVSDDEKKFKFKTLHRSGKEIEKVRQLVNSQLSNAIRDLGKHMPLFATHLERSVKTLAYKAVYSPEHPIPWLVST